jgi:hypothetical protein
MDKVIKKKDLLLSLGFFVEKVYFYNQCYEKKFTNVRIFSIKVVGSCKLKNFQTLTH